MFTNDDELRVIFMYKTPHLDSVEIWLQNSFDFGLLISMTIDTLGCVNQVCNKSKCIKSASQFMQTIC